MPTFSIDLTDIEITAVEATINAGLPAKATPTTCATWLETNVRALVAQCTSAASAKRGNDVGLSTDLTKFGVTAAEQDAIIAARKSAKGG